MLYEWVNDFLPPPKASWEQLRTRTTTSATGYRWLSPLVYVAVILTPRCPSNTWLRPHTDVRKLNRSSCICHLP